ncbi:alpha/beta hydrolase family protein [Paenactinomyces guangxiensis]|uniref:Dienelactone hydrolase family protein n=1 Tax=Paenactinomyces guangxiensis TaxID=1490290 RepID=A0A7W1WRN3_9BACL|nr:dienelactone hydrolase family protein [Paenactinomyces guangxiensis]MBA4494815.1 dienelactone hydrolase family protein [Paenactinomyces guangxiensis]MBH8591898.1 dienelactone hydrolase family protein [Paenactinomyces guangxiensis]
MQQSFVLELGKEDRVIRGEVTIPAGSGYFPAIFVCHGFKGFKDWGFFPVLAERLAEAGFAVITFNFSMNGVGEDLQHFTELDKFARLTFSREQEDLSFLLGQLQRKALPFAERIDPNRLGIMGHSRGGGNSLIFALDHAEIRSVAIWNSIYRTDFFSEEIIREIREKGAAYIENARTGQQMPIHREVLDDIEANKERYNILTRLREFHRPLLIMQGDQDLPGFPEGAQQMADAAPQATLHVIPGANHTMGAVHPFTGMTPFLEEAIRKTAGFFNKTL